MIYVSPERRDLSNPDPVVLSSEVSHPRTIDPATYPILWINRLRRETGLGLKEAFDLVREVNSLMRGEATKEDEHRTLRIVESAEWTRRGMAAEELAKATGELLTLREEAAKARDCATCGVMLDDEEVGFCSTFCFEQHREKIADERRVREIEAQVAGLEQDIRDLKAERDHLVAKHNPEADEDAPEINWDEAPF